VSLFDNSSLDDHFKLGHALSSLRDENIMIVGSGMTAHNLRASMPLLSTGAEDRVYPFTPLFNDAAVEATASKTGAQREEDIRNLFERPELRMAYPTLEHLMPLAVCCGAAGDDIGECLFQKVEYGGMGWSNFVFGRMKETQA
jgi:4,5-DOPA dioxygenase extradiol